MADFMVLAGLLHFCQIPGTVLVYRLVDCRADFARLPPLSRQIVLAMAWGLGLAVLGLGVLVVIFADEVAGGRGLGRGLAGFLALFWGFRVGIQVFAYARRWPRHRRARLTHHALIGLFLGLTLLYTLAFAGGPA